MLKRALIFSFLLSSSFLSAQLSVRKLSRPEKIWVIFHPLKAIKARTVTQQVRHVVDSLSKSGSIGNDMNGGKLDAFRHAYWMASLSQRIGGKQALKLGRAHERGNYLQFKKRLVEDAILPDSVSCEMDLKNNAAAVSRVNSLNARISDQEIRELILKMLREGELFIIKKDPKLNYLHCNGSIIDSNAWLGKWNIPKCLIASDE